MAKKCTIVFYTAENALRKTVPARSLGNAGFSGQGTEKSTPKPQPTRAALASKAVYTGMVSPEKSRSACFYAKQATTIRIDVSDVSREEDPLINSETAPIMAFYKADGTYIGSVTARSMTQPSFCKGVLRSWSGDREDLRKRELAYLQKVKKFEQLVKKKYPLDEDVRAAAAEGSESSCKPEADAIGEDLKKLEEEIRKLVSG